MIAPLVIVVENVKLEEAIVVNREKSNHIVKHVMLFTKLNELNPLRINEETEASHWVVNSKIFELDMHCQIHLRFTFYETIFVSILLLECFYSNILHSSMTTKK